MSSKSTLICIGIFLALTALSPQLGAWFAIATVVYEVGAS